MVVQRGRGWVSLVALVLSTGVQAESEWLVRPPVQLQSPAQIQAPAKAPSPARTVPVHSCNYTKQIKQARRGDVENQYQVALCYYYGLDVEKSIDKAHYWLTKAVLHEHRRAMYQLAELYSRSGDYYRPEEALNWYRRAAISGFAPAQMRLAEMYRDGQGVAQDLIEAYKWFYLAGLYDIEGEPRFRSSVRSKRLSLSAKMQPQQIVEARQRVTEQLAELESRSGQSH